MPSSLLPPPPAPPLPLLLSRSSPFRFHLMSILYKGSRLNQRVPNETPNTRVGLGGSRAPSPNARRRLGGHTAKSKPRIENLVQSVPGLQLFAFDFGVSRAR
eukprot:2553108-Rhodomonas_salina.1